MGLGAHVTGSPRETRAGRRRAGDPARRPQVASPVQRDGVRGLSRLAHITDGASSTLLLGEKQLNPEKFGYTYDDNEPFVAPGWDSEIYRRGSERYPPGPDTQHRSFTADDPHVVFRNVVAQAAKLLNMRRTTLVEKIRKYAIH